MRYLLLFCCAELLFGQGTETKAKVDDYEVHGQAKTAAIGAEYMVHSYSRGEQMFIAKDYLVVEVAIFPPKGATFEVAHTDFFLRINGKKELLETAAPTTVVAEMEHPEFKPPLDGPRVEGGAGLGGVWATAGAPPVNPNPFPGSRPPGQTGPPYPPPEIPRDNPSGVKKEPVNPSEVLLQTALVEGPHHAAISGFVYFPFRGKTSIIKSLELIYQDVVLKLR
jgi:hypothetical protein